MFGVSYASNAPDFRKEYSLYFIDTSRSLSTLYNFDIGKWVEINDENTPEVLYFLFWFNAVFHY